MTDQHWDDIYATRKPSELSWYEAMPSTSLRLINAATPAGRVIDVGAGTSHLADALVAQGYEVTVLDVSAAALAIVEQRLGHHVTYVAADLLTWQPPLTYDLWHDRAVFHFLTDPTEQRHYVSLAAQAVRAGGALVLGTFAADGPANCSGLATARYDADRLFAVFDEFFTLEGCEREDHAPPGGAVQPFTWVTLRRTPFATAG